VVPIKKGGRKAERKLTRKEIAARIGKAVSEILSDSGLRKPEDIREHVRAILGGSSRQEDEMDFSVMFKHFLHEMVQSDLERRRIRGLTAKEVDSTIAGLKSKAKDLPAAIRKALMVIRKDLPRRGGPGRRAVLGSAEKIDACEQVATMFKTKNMPLPQIFEAVASSFRAKGIQVSARTIKRTWENRTKLYT